MRVQVFRHSAYRTPWWREPSPRAGRYHRPGGLIVQYLSCHPLGPAAEMVRHYIGSGGDPDHLKLNLWTAMLEMDCVRIDFENCVGHQITPEQLVGDDYEPTQALAERVEASGVPAMVVPSAALPGTENVILFGRRLSADYLAEPFSEEEIPTGHLSDMARAPQEVITENLLCGFGTQHRGLLHWRDTGELFVLEDPDGARW